jgi:mRNA-degrading endonuclease RelE of RelBE toxin-antitoxin system
MPASMLIDPGFFTAMARLAANEQTRVVDFINAFHANTAHPSIQLHTIDAARSSGMWSGRVTQDLRVILHKDRDVWILLHIDHHDAAYTWAERRDIGRHPITGALQIVELVGTIREVETIVRRAPALAPPLFAAHEDAYLLSLGVPADWLPTLRKIASEDDLLIVCEKLPPDVSERLMDLAGRP